MIFSCGVMCGHGHRFLALSLLLMLPRRSLFGGGRIAIHGCRSISYARVNRAQSLQQLDWKIQDHVYADRIRKQISTTRSFFVSNPNTRI